MDLVNLGAVCGLALQSALFRAARFARNPLGANAPIDRGFRLGEHRPMGTLHRPKPRNGSAWPQSWIRAVMQTESGGYATLDGQPITSPSLEPWG